MQTGSGGDSQAMSIYNHPFESDSWKDGYKDAEWGRKDYNRYDPCDGEDKRDYARGHDRYEQDERDRREERRQEEEQEEREAYDRAQRRAQEQAEIEAYYEQQREPEYPQEPEYPEPPIEKQVPGDETAKQDLKP